MLLVSTDGFVALRSNRVLIDTSALIDGRIIELSKTGFIPGQLLVPEYVLNELQMLADGKDTLKRQRARDGMDAVSELQDSRTVRLKIVRWDGGAKKEVDAQLVHDCKKHHCALLTLDYNLQKIAEIESIKVLNVNELALTLRPLVLPGEIVEVAIVQKGADRGQGVGYLDDATMVVVDKASRLVGTSCTVRVTRTLQTSAGRMMFAERI